MCTTHVHHGRGANWRGARMHRGSPQSSHEVLSTPRRPQHAAPSPRGAAAVLAAAVAARRQVIHCGKWRLKFSNHFLPQACPENLRWKMLTEYPFPSIMSGRGAPAAAARALDAAAPPDALGHRLRRLPGPRGPRRHPGPSRPAIIHFLICHTICHIKTSTRLRRLPGPRRPRRHPSAPCGHLASRPTRPESPSPPSRAPSKSLTRNTEERICWALRHPVRRHPCRVATGGTAISTQHGSGASKISV
jgi:hypothetical protein